VPIYQEISAFLNAFENTVTREKLLFHKLCVDLYYACAERGYALTVFAPEVDREGFDIVLDDGDRERRVQLKSVMATAPTAVWRTTKRFLRPNYRDAEILTFPLTPEGVGVGGAVVLIRCSATSSGLTVRYLFCDVILLSALSNGWVPGKKFAHKTSRRTTSPKTPVEQASALLGALQIGSSDERIKVPKGVFVEAAGPAELLALLELHSSKNQQWCNILRKRLSSEYQTKTHGPLEDLISQELRGLLKLRVS
jgi:hypothetical protein